MLRRLAAAVAWSAMGCTLSGDLCYLSAERCKDSTNGASTTAASTEAGGAGVGGGGTGGASAGGGGSGQTSATGGGGAATGCNVPEPTNLAFPTAEGFGAVSVGGRGGQVVHVTTLDDNGPGSLREALLLPYARFVVFDVSGTIELQGPISLTVTNSFVYVAGQTSPGGVQLKGADGYLQLINGFQDGIFRHLRLRPGGPVSGPRDRSPIWIYGPSDAPVRDLIVDHCDLEWSGAPLFSISGFMSNATYQWNIFAEGLGMDADYSWGGSIISYGNADQITQVNYTIHHNLFSQNAIQTTLYRSGTFDFRNNIIHNWMGNNAASFGSLSNEFSALGNFVGNIYLAGVMSSGKSIFLANGSSTGGSDRGGTRIFAEHNWTPQCVTGCANDWDNGYRTGDSGSTVDALESEFRASTAFDAPPVMTHPTADLVDVVVASVGATRPLRDEASQRMIDDVVARNSFFRMDDGGPWPNLTGPAPPVDRDGDGMPDDWEVAHDLNPDDPMDGSDTSCNGWTNVENYLNELAGDPIP